LKTHGSIRRNRAPFIGGLAMLSSSLSSWPLANVRALLSALASIVLQHSCSLPPLRHHAGLGTLGNTRQLQALFLDE
jgi:hypothetical protein